MKKLLDSLTKELSLLRTPDPLEVVRYAAQKYFIVFCCAVLPDYIPTKFHSFLADYLQGVYENIAAGIDERLMLAMPPQIGKALSVDTPILTTRGWKTMGVIKAGDFVFGSNGSPTKVIAVSPIWINRPVVKVISDDGYSVLADENHEWVLRLDRGYKVWKIYETKKLVSRISPRNPLLPAYKPLKFVKKDLPIDPYVLGLWLGDGHSAGGRITMRSEDMDEIKKYIEQAGFIVRKTNSKYAYGILGLQKKLRQNNLLNNKHIPKKYFFGSIQQRMALLQGLIDTDGYVAPEPQSGAGTVEFCSMKRRLAEGVQKLVVSLGVKAKITVGRAKLNGIDCGEKYRITFLMANAARLFRKASRCRNGTKHPGRYLHFESAGTANTVCIQVVAKDHLFLAGEGLILTHNSTLVSELFPAWIMGKKPWPIVCASYGTALAELKSQHCRDIVDSDIYKYIFPKTRLNPDSTSKEFWQTSNKASYKAVGRGSGLTGHAAKILLADDLLADRAEANSETVRESSWSWWTSVFYTRKQSRSGIILINTRWALDDIQGKIEKQQKENESRFGPAGLYDRWKNISFPAIPDEDIIIDGKILCKAGESLCPERFTVEDFTKTKNSYISTGKVSDWASLFMQTPIIAENAKFQRWWFRYYEPEVLTGKQLYYTTTVDLAISQKKSADYTVIRTVAKEVDGPKWFLMDETRGRLDPLQTIDAIFHHWKQYRSKVFIESVAYQAALQYFLVDEQRKRNEFFTVEEIKPSKLSKKEERIEGLIPLYKAGVIYHRKGQDENLELELMQFPYGNHDDSCDVLAMQLQVVRHAPREQGVEHQEGRLNWKKKRVDNEEFDPHKPFQSI